MPAPRTYFETRHLRRAVLPVAAPGVACEPAAHEECSGGADAARRRRAMVGKTTPRVAFSLNGQTSTRTPRNAMTRAGARGCRGSLRRRARYRDLARAATRRLGRIWCMPQRHLRNPARARCGGRTGVSAGARLDPSAVRPRCAQPVAPRRALPPMGGSRTRRSTSPPTPARCLRDRRQSFAMRSAPRLQSGSCGRGGARPCRRAGGLAEWLALPPPAAARIWADTALDRIPTRSGRRSPSASPCQVVSATPEGAYRNSAPASRPHLDRGSDWTACC